MDKYNDFIIDRLNLNNIEEAKSILKNLLDDEEFKIIESIIFEDKSIAYTGRIFGVSNGKMRHRFYNILRKIGRNKRR